MTKSWGEKRINLSILNMSKVKTVSIAADLDLTKGCGRVQTIRARSYIFIFNGMQGIFTTHRPTAVAHPPPPTWFPRTLAFLHNARAVRDRETMSLDQEIIFS